MRQLENEVRAGYSMNIFPRTIEKVYHDTMELHRVHLEQYTSTVRAYEYEIKFQLLPFSFGIDYLNIQSGITLVRS